MTTTNNCIKRKYNPSSAIKDCLFTFFVWLQQKAKQLNKPVQIISFVQGNNTPNTQNSLPLFTTISPHQHYSSNRRHYFGKPKALLSVNKKNTEPKQRGDNSVLE